MAKAKQEKIDLYKEHKAEYVQAKKPLLVDIGPARYLAVTGQGAPGSDDYSDKIGALYGAAYTIKMTRKFGGEQDYTVCKLESQYWAPDGGADFSALPMDEWCWRLMVRTPDFVAKKELGEAARKLVEKGKGKFIDEVALETIKEGRCVQMLHVGPYDREGETVAQMLEHAAAEGLEPHGLHHEIYLSDPRRVPPERLKTIVRIPVRKRR